MVFVKTVASQLKASKPKMLASKLRLLHRTVSHSGKYGKGNFTLQNPLAYIS